MTVMHATSAVITCMSIPGRIYGRISPKLANLPGTHATTKAHAWVIRRSGGRFTRFFSASELLVLRTTGRRSGRLRESPVIFIEHGDAYVVVASNAASERMPAWWFNLEANPSAEVFVRGKTVPVRARRATADEE